MPDPTTATFSDLPTTAPAPAAAPSSDSGASVVKTVAGIAGSILHAAFPEETVLLLALQALLREAPTLYIDFVQLFTKTAITPEEKLAFNDKLDFLIDPDRPYREAAQRAALGLTPPGVA